MAEQETASARPREVGVAARLVGWVAVIGLGATLLHPQCYVTLNARLLLGAGALAMWVIAALGRQGVLGALPGRLAMVGALAVLFGWTRGVAFVGFDIWGLQVAPSWSTVPLVVLIGAWFVQVARGQANPRTAGPFPLGGLLAGALVILVAAICFPLFGFRYGVGADAFLGLVVTALQFVGLALASLDLFAQPAPRWALVVLGATLAAKAAIAGMGQ